MTFLNDERYSTSWTTSIGEKLLKEVWRHKFTKLAYVGRMGDGAEEGGEEQGVNIFLSTRSYG